jgi:MFS transporter, SHS family, sialic acid transporter
MGFRIGKRAAGGKWMALAAALLGWMFDGLEQGLFPLVGRPALADLLAVNDEKQIGLWFAVALAVFLVGAAAGGVLFGWLGDRIGRVRAMSLSVLAYALFSGFCAVATSAGQVVALRFLSALGMGGEWSLGVALVMEVWPDRSRAVLAGLIGAAANVGYLLIALLGRGLERILPTLSTGLTHLGLSESRVATLTAHSGWRLLMLAGAAPALLAFLIQLFVPESERWKQERSRGMTSNWATRDLLGVGLGTVGTILLIYLWAVPFALVVRVAGSMLCLLAALLGYLFPVFGFLKRSAAGGEAEGGPKSPIRRMLLGACLSGVALLGTWASIQWAPTWADQLAGPLARNDTQIWSALGAIVGTIVAAVAGNWLNRRYAYILLCLGSLATSLTLFQLNRQFGNLFLVCVFLAGGWTASFYGWLPLYLPELFPTRLRATCQGFSYNFGRILAAIGVLQTGNLIGLFEGGYPQACTVMSLIYIAGLGLIWLAPETRGQALPK